MTVTIIHCAFIIHVVASSLASGAPVCNITDGTAVNNNTCVCGDAEYFCDSTTPYCVSSKDTGSLCYWQSMDSTFEIQANLCLFK